MVLPVSQRLRCCNARILGLCEVGQFTLNADARAIERHAKIPRVIPKGEALIAETLHKIGAGRDLSRDEAESVMEELLNGRLEHADIVGLLTTLRTKGETVEELVGFARAMRRHVRPIDFGNAGAVASLPELPLVDT